MTHRRLLLTATLASLAALFTACGKSAAPAQPAPANPPATAQIYKVATDAVYAPFESLNERGEIVGSTSTWCAPWPSGPGCR